MAVSTSQEERSWRISLWDVYVAMIEIEKVLIDITDDRGHVRPVDDVEREVIKVALAHYKNAAEVARRLKIGRSTLYRKLNKYNLRTAR